MYAKTKTKYEIQWNNLQNIYDISHKSTIFYLKNNLLLIYKKKFVKCWTNRKLHFNNHAIFRSKSSYAMLKRKLNIFIDDLKVVVDSLKLLFINQRYDYIKVV